MLKVQKIDTIKKFAKHEKDTGSSEVQIALLTERINYLTKHLEGHRKDHSSRLGLMKLVGQRKRLLNYYKKISDIEDYKKLINILGIRK